MIYHLCGNGKSYNMGWTSIMRQRWTTKFSGDYSFSEVCPTIFCSPVIIIGFHNKLTVLGFTKVKLSIVREIKQVKRSLTICHYVYITLYAHYPHKNIEMYLHKIET